MNISEKQKSLIADFWKTDDYGWLLEIGLQIYIEIFRLNPTVKELFHYVGESEREHRDVRKSTEFQAQSLRFVQILGRAVTNLTDNDPSDEQFESILYQLGRKHQTFASRGFKPDYWDVFEVAVVNVVTERYAKNVNRLNEEDRKTALAGWKIVCNYIIATMKKGFNNEHDNKDLCSMC